MPQVPLPIRQMPASEQTGWVRDIAAAVMQLLTDDEELLYIAVQDQKAPTIKKAGVVATTSRLIIYRPKMIGAFAFTDFYWQDVADVHLKQGMMFAAFAVASTNGSTEIIDYLTRETSQRLYSIAQQYERDWRERRRIRKMEEDRAKAGGVTVNTATYHPAPVPIDMYATQEPAIAAPVSSDPVARLAKAKALLDQGLIGAEEYEALKARILTEI